MFFLSCSRTPVLYEADFPGDRVEQQASIRRGDLLRLVEEALQSRRVGKVRAWEYLGVSLTEALPLPALPEELRSPPAGPEGWIRAQVQRHLNASYPDRLLQPLRIEKAGTVWQIEVAEGGVGERSPRAVGLVVADGQGRVIEDRIAQVADPPRRASRCEGPSCQPLAR